MKYTINTPEGTRDRLFAECRVRRRVQNALTALFRRRRYAEVSTPEVEFYDLFLQSGNPMPQEAMLKLIDRSGKIMVMRPDCTAPIARVAATKLQSLPLPQRLYYDQTVFRSGAEHRGGSSEIAQCGVELIGAAGPKADLEVVALAVDALRACGMERFHIELGHAGFFRALAARMEMGVERVEEMRQLIERKNFAALNDLLEPWQDQPACVALRRLSRLFGGVEVLDEAQALAGAHESLDYLRGLCRELGQGTAEHGGKPCLVYRLEEVVEGPHVKGVVDIVLVAGDKDQRRLTAQREGPDGPGQGRAVGSGQGHVYKEQVHRCPAGEAVLRGGVLGDATGLPLLLDQMGETGPGAGLVITDGNVDHTCFLGSYIG